MEPQWQKVTHNKEKKKVQRFNQDFWKLFDQYVQILDDFRDKSLSLSDFYDRLHTFLQDFDIDSFAQSGNQMRIKMKLDPFWKKLGYELNQSQFTKNAILMLYTYVYYYPDLSNSKIISSLGIPEMSLDDIVLKTRTDGQEPVQKFLHFVFGIFKEIPGRNKEKKRLKKLLEELKTRYQTNSHSLVCAPKSLPQDSIQNLDLEFADYF